MPAEPRPDLLIVGDSHTGAVHAAARARGLNAGLLYISGNHWHENRMRAHPGLGLSAAWRPGLQRQVQAFAAAAGGSVFPPDRPVIASFGYHLGRLAPLLARHGHSPDPQAEGLFLSDGFLQAYVQHHRGALLRILRLAARGGNVIALAPPVVQEGAFPARLAAMITAHLTAQGVRVFDPRASGDWMAQPLPAQMRAPDGVHGNAAWGEAVLQRLQVLGWLPELAGAGKG